MFEIGIIESFEAAHALEGDFGPATRLHGHTYRVEAVVEAREVGADGTFYDISRLRADLRAVLDRMHYRDLGELEELRGVNTTAEEVARHIARQLAESLRGAGLLSLKVTVWESPAAFASYRQTFEDAAAGAGGPPRH